MARESNMKSPCAPCLRGAIAFSLVLGGSGCKTEDPYARLPALPLSTYGALKMHVPLAPGTDLAALQGRRIVVDPGHGGEHSGTVGKTGVTESELNLAVALHL